MIKVVLERGTQAELAEHLGYDKHDPAGQGQRELPQRDNTQDCHHGSRGCAAGPAPRSQREFHLGVGSQGSASTGWGGGHDHQPVCGRYDHPRHPAPPRRDAGDRVVPRDDQQAPPRPLLPRRSPAGRPAPLESFYPMVYFDALMVKVRNGTHMANRSAHITVGVDIDGIKHMLGIWVQATEDAKFWARVCANLANHGVRDVLIVCCDGLTSSCRRRSPQPGPMPRSRHV